MQAFKRAYKPRTFAWKSKKTRIRDFESSVVLAKLSPLCLTMESPSYHTSTFFAHCEMYEPALPITACYTICRQVQSPRQQDWLLDSIVNGHSLAVLSWQTTQLPLYYTSVSEAHQFRLGSDILLREHLCKDSD